MYICIEDVVEVPAVPYEKAGQTAILTVTRGVLHPEIVRVFEDVDAGMKIVHMFDDEPNGLSFYSYFSRGCDVKDFVLYVHHLGESRFRMAREHLSNLKPKTPVERRPGMADIVDVLPGS